MSYQVIIADDEPKILQLIKLLGHWEAYNIEIVDECHDGRETLRSIMKNKPDLVISDIKMPELDGIELIQETRKAGISSLFILVSGYRHFEYARSAVALNVVDYLLKPVDEEQLNKTLEKVCRQLDKVSEERDTELALFKIKSARTRGRLEEFWNELIHNEVRDRMTPWLFTKELCNEHYHTEFCYNSYHVVTMATNLSGIFVQHNSLLEDEIERRISSFLPDGLICYYYMNYLGCVFVMNFDGKDRRKMREHIDELYYGIRDLSEIYGAFGLNIGVSELKTQIAGIKEAFVEAQAAEWSRLIMMQNGIIEYSQISRLPQKSRETIFTTDELEKAKVCVKYLQREELGEIFNILYQRALSAEPISPRSISAAFFYLEESLIACLKKEDQKKMKENCDYAYLEGKNFPQVLQNLYLKLDHYMAEEQNHAKVRVGKPLGEAVKYIKLHYAKPVCQEEVARVSNVSPTYLSKLFKDELGIGFTEFLTQTRLEESEKLLADTSLTIKEIAVATGYPDEKYYSKLFKKSTGLKPSEYRKIYGS